MRHNRTRIWLLLIPLWAPFTYAQDSPQYTKDMEAAHRAAGLARTVRVIGEGGALLSDGWGLVKDHALPENKPSKKRQKLSKGGTRSGGTRGSPFGKVGTFGKIAAKGGAVVEAVGFLAGAGAYIAERYETEYNDQMLDLALKNYGSGYDGAALQRHVTQIDSTRPGSAERAKAQADLTRSLETMVVGDPAVTRHFFSTAGEVAAYEFAKAGARFSAEQVAALRDVQNRQQSQLDGVTKVVQQHGQRLASLEARMEKVEEDYATVSTQIKKLEDIITRQNDVNLSQAVDMILTSGAGPAELAEIAKNVSNPEAKRILQDTTFVSVMQTSQTVSRASGILGQFLSGVGANDAAQTVNAISEKVGCGVNLLAAAATGDVLGAAGAFISMIFGVPDPAAERHAQVMREFGKLHERFDRIEAKLDVIAAKIDDLKDSIEEKHLAQMDELNNIKHGIRQVMIGVQSDIAGDLSACIARLNQRFAYGPDSWKAQMKSLQGDDQYRALQVFPGFASEQRMTDYLASANGSALDDCWARTGALLRENLEGGLLNPVFVHPFGAQEVGLEAATQAHVGRIQELLSAPPGLWTPSNRQGSEKLPLGVVLKELLNPNAETAGVASAFTSEALLAPATTAYDLSRSVLMLRANVSWFGPFEGWEISQAPWRKRPRDILTEIFELTTPKKGLGWINAPRVTAYARIAMEIAKMRMSPNAASINYQANLENDPITVLHPVARLLDLAIAQGSLLSGEVLIPVLEDILTEAYRIIPEVQTERLRELAIELLRENSILFQNYFSYRMHRIYTQRYPVKDGPFAREAYGLCFERRGSQFHLMESYLPPEFKIERSSAQPGMVEVVLDPTHKRFAALPTPAEIVDGRIHLPPALMDAIEARETLAQFLRLYPQTPNSKEKR